MDQIMVMLTMFQWKDIIINFILEKSLLETHTQRFFFCNLKHQLTNVDLQMLINVCNLCLLFKVNFLIGIRLDTLILLKKLLGFNFEIHFQKHTLKMNKKLKKTYIRLTRSLMKPHSRSYKDYVMLLILLIFLMIILKNSFALVQLTNVLKLIFII